MKNKEWEPSNPDQWKYPKQPAQGNPRERRYWQWAISRDPDLSGTAKTLLHALALRMKPDGEAARVRYEVLARDLRCSQELIRRVVPEVVSRGYLRLFWARENPSLATEWCPCFPGDSREQAKDELLQLWFQAPTPRPPLKEDDPADWWEMQERSPKVRWYWERALRDRTNLPLRVRGLLWTIGLFSTGDGRVRRKMSVPFLAQRTGFSVDSVRRYLKVAIAARWLYSLEETGGKNIIRYFLLTLRFPDGDPDFDGGEDNLDSD